MKIYFDDKLKVFADTGKHTIKTDQPVKAGSDGEFPTPFTTFLASVGTCAGIFVKGFCDRRKIPTDNISLSQQVFFDRSKGIIGRIDITIHVPGDFPEKYDQAVMASARHCSVKKHLRDDIEINVNIQRS